METAPFENKKNALTFNVEFDFCGGRLSEPVVGCADVDAGVVPGDFGEGQGHALGGLAAVGHLAPLLPPPLDLRGRPSLGHLTGQGHRLARLGHDDPVRRGGLDLRAD